MEQPSVSKHLRVLRDVGLVRMRCQGRKQAATGPTPKRYVLCTSGPNLRALLAAPVESKTKDERKHGPCGPTELNSPNRIQREIMISTEQTLKSDLIRLN